MRFHIIEYIDIYHYINVQGALHSTKRIHINNVLITCVTAFFSSRQSWPNHECVWTQGSCRRIMGYVWTQGSCSQSVVILSWSNFVKFVSKATTKKFLHFDTSIDTNQKFLMLCSADIRFWLVINLLSLLKNFNIKSSFRNLLFLVTHQFSW